MLNYMFDNWDLGPASVVLGLVGIVLSVWCHQLWGRHVFGNESAHSVQIMQRAAFICYALSQCWVLSYQYLHDWQPWPPYLASLFAVDLYLFSIIIAAMHRRRVTG